jgi:hypothetical protein
MVERTCAPLLCSGLPFLYVSHDLKPAAFSQIGAVDRVLTLLRNFGRY